MQIISQGDDSHEMSAYFFWKTNNNKKFKMLSATKFAWRFNI